MFSGEAFLLRGKWHFLSKSLLRRGQQHRRRVQTGAGLIPVLCSPMGTQKAFSTPPKLGVRTNENQSLAMGLTSELYRKDSKQEGKGREDVCLPTLDTHSPPDLMSSQGTPHWKGDQPWSSHSQTFLRTGVRVSLRPGHQPTQAADV